MVNPDFSTTSSENQFGLPEPVVVSEGTGQTGLTYQVIGTTVPSLILRLSPGQTVYTESGGIGWMSPNVTFNARVHEGSFGTIFKRAVFGKSLFWVDYTSQEGEAVLSFTSSFPGRIVPVHLETGQEIIVQRKRFLCAEATVKLEVCFQQTLTTSLLGGMDFVLQKLSGAGVAFVTLDGDSVVYTLAAGQVMKADPELIAMYDPTVNFDIEMISGVKNIFFSGRKMYQTVLRGPGRVFLQTMAIKKLAHAISPYLPKMPATTTATGTRKRRPHQEQETQED